MIVETLCTGDELLSGTVVDTNSAHFAARVFERGVLLRRTEVVGDRLDDLVAALRGLYERAEFAVVSGGLGPTVDDLTAEAAAAAAGVPLEVHGPTLERLREGFRRRNLEFTPNNERQARVPAGADVVANRYGTAPMVVLRRGRATVCFLPGVPREFTRLCDEEVVPRLESALRAWRAANASAAVVRAFRTLKCYGLAESHVDHAVRDFPARHPRVRVAFRTTLPENHLKLWAEGPTEAEAQAALAAAEADARAALGDRVFGTDQESFAAAIGRILRERGATVALAESCTGGLAAATLSEVAGASDYLLASAVVYADAAKSRLGGVAEDLVAREGPVSEAVTRALARNARALGATLGLAVTGYAGPGEGPHPAGTVFVALSAADRELAESHRFGGDRERVRRFAAYAVLDQVRSYYRGRA